MGHEAWRRYRDRLWFDGGLGVSLDVSRMDMDAGVFDSLRPGFQSAFRDMDALENGAIANPDEQRQVGHYWLRAPDLAPDSAIADEIRDTVERIREFVDRVHRGEVRPARGERFTDFLLVGIGGSALGPELVADALVGPGDRMRAHFFDNTDPDGFDRVLAGLGDDLARTLTVVVSKSGGTKETRNGMLEAAAAYERAGLVLGPHAVAVTGEGSALETEARKRGFLDVFPMWDWVGGRTSELSAVGLLPAALQGIDIDEMLAGAREMDVCTRVHEVERNPAALLAASWYVAGEGHGARDMVILPYKDRLLLLSRYLQQLVMESLGKEKDLEGRVVHQGITVYGNKGSTDQHAFVQQLRDGPDTFFVTFLEVLKDREGKSLAVEGEFTSGDFLQGFLLGTRDALHETGRRSLTITLPDVSPRALGMLIALFERAVGLYASLVGINAYHQPGVEAGKKAAAGVLELLAAALAVLRKEPGREWSAEEVAGELGRESDAETVFQVLRHAAANPDHGVVVSEAVPCTGSTFRAE